MIQRVLFIGGKTFYVSDISKDFHTQFGFVKNEDLIKTHSETNTGKKVLSLQASFIDTFKTLKRGPQIITLKDASSIAAYTGVSKDSIVVEAGTGSGFLACFLARIAKKVYSFDLKKDSVKLGIRNAKSLELDNIEFAEGDISQDIPVKSCDVFILDLPNPHDCLNTVSKVLKPGGILACYLPCITQVEKLINELDDLFIHELTIENIEREWHIHSPKVRPVSDAVSHTGFLTFVRKI